MALRSGPLREKVIVQVTTPSQDSYGEPIDSWGTYVTRWAEVTPINGTEKWAGNENLAQVTHRFRIRYDSSTKSITPKHRISYDSRIFDILSATNTGTRDREIIIMAEEKV